MPASYDNYDYPGYWKDRSYEHKSEILAVRNLLEKIPYIGTLADIGGGFGRLVNAYRHRVKKVYLIDPSARLLAKAKKDLVAIHKIVYLQSSLEKILEKDIPTKFDVVVMVRVLHHITDIDNAFEVLSKIIVKNGYLIMEFANKNHWKAVLTNFLHGNFTFPLDIFSIDRRSTRSKKKNTIAFLNHHPDIISNKLQQKGFVVIDKLSVSNLRTGFLKKLLSQESLLNLEKKLQKPLAKVNFGPSIFILAKKVSD